MKTRIRYTLQLLLLLAAFSCDSVLDKQPLDKMATSTFWKSESDAQLALTACYNSLNYDLMSWNMTTIDAMSDDLFNQYNHNSVASLGSGIIESTSGGAVNDIWKYCYNGIARCNFFLDGIEKVKMSDSGKEVLIGEARFLRAHFYFYLTEFYGGVPLYLKSPTIEEANNATRASKEAVLNAIYADLDFAIAKLPDQKYNGHAVKASAQALKARVLLHNERWSEAAPLASEVIRNSNFGLSPTYMSIWNNKEQEKNPEIIFSVKYLNPNLSQPNYGADIVFGSWNSTVPIRYIIDEYECTDGRPTSESPLFDPQKPYDNRDPRLRWCSYVDLDPWYYGQDVLGDGVKRWRPGMSGGGSPPPTEFLLKKYENTSYLPYSYSTKTDYDAVLIRYAEMLLIFAEAQNEAVGPDASVYEAVNRVRARVGMPNLPAGLSKEQMRERIRRERRIEMAFEGKRFLDIRRWKIAHLVIPKVIDPNGSARKFENPKHYLFPIPQFEIDINPNLKQNPGY